MIGRLKRKLTILATVSILILISALVFIMNVVNFTSVVSDCDLILDVLFENESQFLDGKELSNNERNYSGTSYFTDLGLSPEISYESRYFTADVSQNGEIKDINLSQVISVDKEDAKEYVNKALTKPTDRGFVDYYRYKKVVSDGITVIMFLDCGRKLDSFFSFLFISMEVALLGCVAVFIIFLFVAGRIVKPIAESYEKQKRFVSDAGHEIKTPLTIINANIDLMELDFDEEKEELVEIRNQTRRLTEFASNLVTLSKMEEDVNAYSKVNFPLSDTVKETISSFLAPAESKGINLFSDIKDGLSAEGVPGAIKQLVSILVENALKYSPANSTVTIKLSAGKKTAELSVANPTIARIKEEEIKHVFDRFYRTDKSRNSETGGHGIGLSIAKAIVETHGGKIKATTGENGNEFKISAIIPIINR